MGVEHRFSSLHARGAQQYERFRDAVSATHLAWDMRARPRQPFRGTIESRTVGSATLIDCACDPCDGRRARHELARSPEARFGVLCVLSGRERIAQRRETDLPEGTLAIWDSTQPLAFSVPAPLHKLTLLLPEDVLLAAIPDARAHVGVPLDARSGLGALFLGQLRALHRMDGALAPAHQALALRTTLDLLAGALDRTDGTTGALLGEILRHARARLADPELDPESIAGALGLSRRQLDRVFAGTGTTITRWIWRERALRCRRDMLLEPRARLIDIAFRWGFSDAAHFSRVFRRELGTSPRACRAAATRSSRFWDSA